jgi:hypothetical protein
MVLPSSLITIEFGWYGRRTGAPICGCVKSTGTRYSEFVLAIYRFVLLMPGAVTVIGFEVTALPLPNKPIWLNGEGLQLGGWQIAVIAAAPGKVGVTDPVEAAGIVVGVVDSNSRLKPVNTVLFLSMTTALIGCRLLGFTTTLPELDPAMPGTLSAIEVGGQVAKKPAELPAFEIFAVITVDPGCCAVATPFWSIETIEPICAVYERWPTLQLILFASVVDAFWYTRAASCPVVPCDAQLLRGTAFCDVTGAVQQPVPGSIVQLTCWLPNAAGLQFVAGSLRQSVDSGPSTTLVTTG